MPSTGQAPPLADQEIESMLKENHYARICTHNKDGTIHAVPVAYAYINGQIMMMSYINSLKNRNIERNNDVTVLVDTLSPVTRGILIYGKAEIDCDSVYEKVLAINELSPAFQGMRKEKLERITRAYVDMFKLVVLRITPKRIITFDYSKDELWNKFVKTYLQE